MPYGNGRDGGGGPPCVKLTPSKEGLDPDARMLTRCIRKTPPPEKVTTDRMIAKRVALYRSPPPHTHTHTVQPSGFDALHGGKICPPGGRGVLVSTPFLQV